MHCTTVHLILACADPCLVPEGYTFYDQTTHMNDDIGGCTQMSYSRTNAQLAQECNANAGCAAFATSGEWYW